MNFLSRYEWNLLFGGIIVQIFWMGFLLLGTVGPDRMPWLTAGHLALYALSFALNVMIWPYLRRIPREWLTITWGTFIAAFAAIGLWFVVLQGRNPYYLHIPARDCLFLFLPLAYGAAVFLHFMMLLVFPKSAWRNRTR